MVNNSIPAAHAHKSTHTHTQPPIYIYILYAYFHPSHSIIIKKEVEVATIIYRAATPT